MNTHNTEAKYNVLDLFAGAGGFSRGFLNAKRYRIVAAVDNWAPAAATYRRNFPAVNFIEGDITDPSIQERIIAAFAGIRCHVIAGGPPCQAFSLAGRRDPNDPRARLFEHYLDIVNRLRPMIFLMENVRGILSAKLDGKPVPETIQQRFAEIGYNVRYRLTNAADYGVPQIRLRVIFLGAPHGVEPEFPLPTHQEAR